MQIKRKDLEQIVQALYSDARISDIITARVLGQSLLNPPPDPVDVVPVQDYPFKLPDAVKPYGEGPT